MVPSATPLQTSKVFRLHKNRKFLGGKLDVGVVLTGAKDSDVFLALVKNDPFPDRQIKMGEISLSVDGGNSIQFGSRNKKVTFSADASAFSGLGFYPNPKNMLKELRPNENIAPGVDFPEDPHSSYLMLRWGYGLSGAAKGAVALGTGAAVTFGAEGNRQGAFAVIRRLPKPTGARTAVKETVQSWILPRQVSTHRDLQPGTWLVAEVNGSIAASLGVEFGYDFNWVHEAELGGLSGDIGLRLQLGVAAALGFEASGKYALVVARESLDKKDKVVRLGLFKLSTRGWNFALTSGIQVKGDFKKFLPDQADDFIKAVFGVHGEQIIRDLHAIEKWTDPDTDLSDELAGLTSKYGQELLKDATGIDPKTAFQEARGRLLDLIRKWDDLDHRVSTLIWKFVEKKVDLDPVRDIAQMIADGNRKAMADALAEKLGQVDFFRTEEGKLLQAVAPRGILLALNSAPHFAEMQKAAKAVVKVLDKGTVEETLGRLQKTVEKRLSLDKVRKVITKNDFDKLDDWLKTKLSEFLDDTLNLKRLDQVRKTITLFLSKRKEFYKKAVKALNRQYEFNFAYAYQSSTRQTALFDIHFDFAQGDQVIGLLKAALNGDFDKVMVKQVKGVTLNLATLTHQLQRQSHVEVSLPFSKKSAKHINTALAKANVIEEEDGRVLVYELDAKNKVGSIVRGKMVRDSSLAVGGTWKTRLGNAVRQHNTESISYSYSFRQARRKMKSADLQYQLKPYVETYFPSSFSTGTSGAQSFDTWIALLDRFIDESQDNGEDIFGDTLISLEVSLPGGLASAWLKAPKKDSSLYRTMSRKIQEALKQLIPFYYFQDPAKYKDLAAAAPLLLYSSIPAANSLQIRGSLATLNKGKSLYWNWPDPKQRNIMANLPTTLASLNLAVRRAFDVLVSRPELAKTQEFYRGEQACKRILETSLNTTQGRTNLERLLRAESVIVKSAHKAGSELAKFRKNQSRQPTKAIESLAKFGSSLTEAFNKKFTSIYGKGSLRPLSTLVFSEAAKALDPSLGKEKPQAMLALSVLKEGAAFTLADFENNQMPEKEDLVVEERLVNLG